MATEGTIERALCAVPHLIHCAQTRKTITYGQLAEEVGCHHRAVGHFLYYIRDELCTPRGLPLLTAIVVRKGTQLPGYGWLPEGTMGLKEDETRRRFEEACEDVYACREWDGLLEELGLSPIGGTDGVLHEEGLAYHKTSEREVQVQPGQQRREMKEYVAQNPAAIGLQAAEPGETNYVFVSGDKCDVVFDLGENGHAVVVAKPGQRGELVVGIYEAIKCRALMEAEKGRGRDYPVSAHVVARDIPEDIAAFANRFDVRAVTLREDL